ncbi:MAG: ABC transporter ATP-binding protein [Nitrososphaerales archaeon]
MTTLVAQETSSLARSGGPIIEVRNLSKHFVKGSKTAAVDNVSFTVGKEILTLLGPSGCGKTTTLRCIAGLEKPDRGEILIAGKLVTSTEKRIFASPEKRNIGLVFQSYALWPHMKVFDNVAYGLKVRHAPKPEIKERVAKALERVGLTGYEKRYPAQLSGGQQQRVALARSLVYEPKVLLLDEPLSNLDAKIREKTRIELKSLLSSLDVSSVYVTHDQEEAFLLSDQIVVMNQGRVVQTDTPFNVYNYPANEFVATFVGRTNMVQGTVMSGGDNGMIRIFGKYDVVCDVPENLAAGENCSVVMRSNEIGILREKPPAGAVIPCEVISREYKGAVTDHVVKVSDSTLVITTHRFCDLNDVHKDLEGNMSKDTMYLDIRPGSVTVVPKSA